MHRWIQIAGFSGSLESTCYLVLLAKMFSHGLLSATWRRTFIQAFSTQEMQDFLPPTRKVLNDIARLGVEQSVAW